MMFAKEMDAFFSFGLVIEGLDITKTLRYSHHTTISHYHWPTAIGDCARMYSRVNNTRLYQQLVENIRQQILNDQLREGDRLPNERDLALSFGVSRTVVREAIKTLAKEGLVEVRHGIGTFIAIRTSQALSQSFDLMMMIEGGHGSNDIVEIREILEPSIAALAALRATDDDIESLKTDVRKMDASMEDMEGFVTADHSFHVTLARATHNIIIPHLLNPIVDLLHWQRKRIFYVEQGPQSGQYYHKQILDAVIRRDSDGAREAMIAHLKQVRDHTAVGPTDSREGH